MNEELQHVHSALLFLLVMDSANTSDDGHSIAQIDRSSAQEPDPMKRLLIIFAALFPFQGSFAQQNEVPQHKFLNWRNITIMSTAAGGHVWAAKEYNGPGYTATEVMELKYHQDFSFHPGYSYAKEFSQMGLATTLAQMFHRTNHHKMERWFLVGDSFVAYGAGLVYAKHYNQVDCQIQAATCKRQAAAIAGPGLEQLALDLWRGTVRKSPLVRKAAE